MWELDILILGFGLCIIKNGQAYDTFSGNRNPIGGLTQGGRKKNSLTTFRGSAKATYDFSKWVKGLSISGFGGL